VKISITEARKLGIVSKKNRSSPHYADAARAKGKANTQVKAWNTLKSQKS
jgi:hypothetical protein